MTRSTRQFTPIVLEMYWVRERHNRHVIRGMCPGRGCGRRIAQASGPISLEKGYVQSDLIVDAQRVYVKSHRFADIYGGLSSKKRARAVAQPRKRPVFTGVCDGTFSLGGQWAVVTG